MCTEYEPITKRQARERLCSYAAVARALGLTPDAVARWPKDEPLDRRSSLAVERAAQLRLGGRPK